MRRIGLLLGTLGLILVIGVGLLVMRALRSIQEEEELRHEVVAARLFDEFERELTGLLEREEERSFLEYRTFFVPESQVPGNPSMSVSPLAAGPTDPYVVGWYQVEPDGALNLPWRPRPHEEQWATLNGLDLGGHAPSLSDNEQTIEELTERLLQPVRDEWNLRLEAAAEARDQLQLDGRVALSTTDSTSRAKTPSRANTTSTNKDPVPKKESASPARAPASPPPKGGETEAQAALEGATAGLSRSEPSTTSGAATADLDDRQDATTQQAARRDAGDAAEAVVQREREAGARVEQPGADRAAADAEGAEEEDARNEPKDEVAQAVGVSSTRAPGPRASAPSGGLKRRKKPGKAGGSSDVAVLESLNRGGSSRQQRQTRSSSYSQGNAELFKNDEEVGIVQGEIAFEPTPEEVLESDEQPEEEQVQQAEEVSEFDAERVAAVVAEDDDPVVTTETVAAASAPQAADHRPLQEDAETTLVPALRSEVTPAPAPEPTPEPQFSPDPPVEKKPKPPKRARVAQAEPAIPSEPVELLVTVSPFSAYRPDAEHLVLHRDVHVGSDRYVQGLVLLLPELIRALHSEIVGTDIEDAVEFAWRDVGIITGGPVEGRYSFAHTFEEPFESLAAGVTLGTIRREGQDPRSWVVFLAIVLGIIGTLGFGGLYRSVAVVVHFSERRNNFVAAVTHELKTPLTAIRMYGEILRDGLVVDEAKKQDYYGIITTESDRLGRLINNVLELSNLEKGSRPMRLEVGSMATVLEDVCRVLGPHARERGLTLVTEVAADLPPATFDRDALLQVVINLVDNAIKFSAGSDDKRILLTASEGIITIRDHGPGVPSAQLNRIFQPFFRGERELTRTTKGTGIGLALVRGLVEQMGGRVIARNHPLGGFEVSIAL